jgi:hypothetical protein
MLLSTPQGSAEITAIALPLIKAFNGQRTTTEVFHLAYQVMYSLDAELEKLIGIQALIPHKHQA